MEDTLSPRAAAHLRDQMTQAGLTTQSLASGLGVSVNKVSRLMSGDHQWSAGDIGTITGYFNISVAALFDDADRLVAA